MDTDARRDVPGRPRFDLKGQAKRGINFLLIGGVGFVVDAAIFNALVYWGGSGPLFEQPLLAKVIAILVATVVTYYGNAWLTFRDRPARRTPRQFLAYALLNVAAILIQLACIGFSRYVLGLADPVSDNVSGTLIGQGLATLFRYFTYSRWVFAHQPGQAGGRPLS